MKTRQTILRVVIFLIVLNPGLRTSSVAQEHHKNFKVIAFFTNRNDTAHITWVHEANKWFHKMGALHHFSYDSTKNWNNLNAEFLSHYQVVLFRDTRPDGEA